MKSGTPAPLPLARMWQLCYAGVRGARRTMAPSVVRMNTSNVELRFCSTKSMVEYPAEHQAIIPPPTSVAPLGVSGWMDGSASGGPTRERAIFCNRTINMSQMEAIGFDMVCLQFLRMSSSLSVAISKDSPEPEMFRTSNMLPIPRPLCPGVTRLGRSGSCS